MGTAPQSLAWWVVATLMSAHALIGVLNLTPIMRRPWVPNLLDMDREATAVAWLSSATLLGIAALCFAVGWLAPSRVRTRAGWWVIGIWFALLSLDETAGLHDLAGEITQTYAEADWLIAGGWVIVVAPLAAVIAVRMLFWLGRTLGWRSAAGRMTLIAFALWFTVPVLELLGSVWERPRWLMVIEELAEGFGEALMAGALVSHLAQMGIVVRAEDPSG